MRNWNSPTLWFSLTRPIIASIISTKHLSLALYGSGTRLIQILLTWACVVITGVLAVGVIASEESGDWLFVLGFGRYIIIWVIKTVVTCYDLTLRMRLSFIYTLYSDTGVSICTLFLKYRSFKSINLRSNTFFAVNCTQYNQKYYQNRNSDATYKHENVIEFFLFWFRCTLIFQL